MGFLSSFFAGHVLPVRHIDVQTRRLSPICCSLLRTASLESRQSSGDTRQETFLTA